MVAKAVRNADPVTAYARDVVRGHVLAGRLQILACERHLRDLERQDTDALPFVFDVDEAQRRIAFFRLLRHSKGEWAGQAFALAPWQAFIVGSLFGWRHRETGLRRFRVGYNEIPRKNGKSTLAAGIAINLAFFDNEDGAEVYCAATKKDQARIVFDECKRMVAKTPLLKARIQSLVSNLSVLSRAQKLEPLGADEDTLDGLNVHGAVIDELHAHKTRGVVDVLETATGARRQSLEFDITTAGYDRHSVCWERREYSVKVLEGVVEDPTWFAMIFTLDEGDDWRDERTWRKANPNLGVSIKLDDLRRLAVKAQEQPTAQNAFLRLRLNVWTEQAERAIDLVVWDKKNAGELDWRALRERGAGRPAYLGLDLASTTDLAGGCWLFEEDGWIDLVPRIFIPRERLQERVKRDRVPYDVWLKAGALEATEGDVVDYDVIRQRLNEDGDRYQVKGCGYDPWNATQLATQLQGDGFAMTPIRQGHASMGEPTKRFLALLVAGRLRHGGHPVLRWAAMNFTVRHDANGNFCPDKAKASEKIDPIVMAIIGLAVLIREPEARESVYKKRGAHVVR